MKIPILKEKDDASHYRIAMSAPGFFEVGTTAKQETTVTKKDSSRLCRIKFKYALCSPPFMCFNASVNRLKKNP